MLSACDCVIVMTRISNGTSYVCGYTKFQVCGYTKCQTVSYDECQELCVYNCKLNGI